MSRHEIRNSQTTGFTLVELVLVLAIIAVLGAIASPRYARSMSLYRASCAAKRIAVDLSLAQSMARTRSSSQSVTFNVETHSYELAGMADIERASRKHAVDLSSEPYSSQIVSVELGGDSTIVFNGWGVPDSGGTIVVRSGDFTRTINIDAATGGVNVR